MENSSPLMGDPAPTVDRHTTTAFAGRQPSLLSKSDDTFANTPVMVSHREENEERVALNSADIQRIPAPSLL